MLRHRIWLLGLVILVSSSLACNLLAQTQVPTPTPPPTATTPPTDIPPTITPLVPTQGPVVQATPQFVFTAQLPPTTVPTSTFCAVRSDWPTYAVVAGDTLYSIARATGSTIDELAGANCLPNANQLEVGQILYVPQAAPAAAPTATSTVAAPQQFYGMEIYLIAIGDQSGSGLPVGCGDAAISQQTARQPTGDLATDLRAALEEMFAVRTGNTTSGIVNAFESSPLTVQSVTVSGSQATIQLGGPLILSGTCADARMEAQLVLNVFKYGVISSALITVDGQNIKQTFDMSGQTGSADPYTRADADRLSGTSAGPVHAVTVNHTRWGHFPIAGM
jgi:LysM repeat protein